MAYAKDTSVSVEKSKAEIAEVLRRFGCDAFQSGWMDNREIIAFRYKGKFLRFTLIVPDQKDAKYKVTPGGRRKRNDQASFTEWERDCRSIWRALRMLIYMKLESCERNIFDQMFEREFMAYFVGANNETIAETVLPKLDKLLKGTLSAQKILGLPPPRADADVIDMEKAQ